jgi:hypothetical protein
MLGGGYGDFVLLTVFRKRLYRYGRQPGSRAVSRAWQSAQIAMQGLEIPFGVFLCVTSTVTWFYGAQMIQAYLRLFMISG